MHPSHDDTTLEEKLGSFEGCRKNTHFQTGPLLLPERCPENEVDFLTSSEWPEILYVSQYAHFHTESNK